MPQTWRDAVGHVIVRGRRGLGASIVEQLHAAGVDVVVVDDAIDRPLITALEG